MFGNAYGIKGKSDKKKTVRWRCNKRAKKEGSATIEARHIIFATDTQLKVLREAKKINGDGTFKVPPKPFAQLFSLHAFIAFEKQVKQVPLIFVFMSRRTAEDYEAVLKHIKQMCESMDENLPAFLDFTDFVCDFERAVWKAIRTVFPKVTIRGCGFHLRQAIFRKIQELGLATSYFHNVEIRQLCRMLMTLNLQPPEKIVERFNDIRNKVTDNEKLTKLFKYFEKKLD